MGLAQLDPKAKVILQRELELYFELKDGAEAIHEDLERRLLAGAPVEGGIYGIGSFDRRDAVAAKVYRRWLVREIGERKVRRKERGLHRVWQTVVALTRPRNSS